jgi:hypothetical protein
LIPIKIKAIIKLQFSGQERIGRINYPGKKETETDTCMIGFSLDLSSNTTNCRIVFFIRLEKENWSKNLESNTVRRHRYIEQNERRFGKYAGCFGLILKFPESQTTGLFLGVHAFLK